MRLALRYSRLCTASVSAQHSGPSTLCPITTTYLWWSPAWWFTLMTYIVVFVHLYSVMLHRLSSSFCGSVKWHSLKSSLSVQTLQSKTAKLNSLPNYFLYVAQWSSFIIQHYFFMVDKRAELFVMSWMKPKREPKSVAMSDNFLFVFHELLPWLKCLVASEMFFFKGRNGTSVCWISVEAWPLFDTQMF